MSVSGAEQSKNETIHSKGWGVQRTTKEVPAIAGRVELSNEGDYVHRDCLFQLSARHPHGGEFAHPIGKTPETITIYDLFGAEACLVELIDCEHGVNRAFAVKGNMILVKGLPSAQRSCAR